jgi:hypothetical protein
MFTDAFNVVVANAGALLENDTHILRIHFVHPNAILLVQHNGVFVYVTRIHFQHFWLDYLPLVFRGTVKRCLRKGF